MHLLQSFPDSFLMIVSGNELLNSLTVLLLRLLLQIYLRNLWHQSWIVEVKKPWPSHFRKYVIVLSILHHVSVACLESLIL